MLEAQENLSLEPPIEQLGENVEEGNKQSQEASQRVKKRKDAPQKRKKSRKLKSSQLIDDGSSEGQSLQKHKKLKKKKVKSAKQQENLSFDK